MHGGGPQIEELLETARVESRFHEGLRITDTATMNYVAMALSQVNLARTASLNHAGLPVSDSRAGRIGLVGRAHWASLGPSAQARRPPCAPRSSRSLWANGSRRS